MKWLIPYGSIWWHKSQQHINKISNSPWVKDIIDFKSKASAHQPSPIREHAQAQTRLRICNVSYHSDTFIGASHLNKRKQHMNTSEVKILYK